MRNGQQRYTVHSNHSGQRQHATDRMLRPHRDSPQIDARPAATQQRQSQRRHDRIDCPHCGMSIIPRLVIYAGQPTMSVCVFCAGIVRDFRKPSLLFRLAILGIKGLCGLIAFRLVLSVLDQWAW